MDIDALVDRVGAARIVMLGEASHGTHDYYVLRERLTRRLIAQLGFSFVAVEGDWPDCDRVNEAVTRGGDTDEALRSFTRWPTWMWANSEVAGFCRWLRDWNSAGGAVGFHGLDVYSLWESLHAVAGYVREHDPSALDAIWQAYRCFEPYGEDPQRYAQATRFATEDCEDEVVRLLAQARSQPIEFGAWQNVNVIAEAERYYRTMIRGGARSWNIRDTHMMNTLDRLLEHYGPHAKAVVWAHNTHVGDAGATDMADAGMTNIGRLARERHGEENVVLVGFGSHRGSVIAAPRWGDPWRQMTVPPARAGSLEDVLRHELPARALTVFDDVDGRQKPGWLRERLDHRAIGVVYHPDVERWGNYVPTVLRRRYDAFVWCEQTSALHPLHAAAARGELETYPTGV